jgi:capsular exopolysaccharide synthesis family protein
VNAGQLHLLMMAVRRRALLVASCSAVVLILAIVYCVVAPRTYESTASLLVQYNLEGLNKNSKDLPTGQFDDLSTQTRLITSPVVLNRALASLQPEQLGPALAPLSPDERRKVLESTLQVSSSRGTRLIQLAYRAPIPETTTAIVSAVTDSYLQFIRETHRTNSHEVLEVLTRQKNELEERLLESENELLKLRQESGLLLSEKVQTNISEKRIAALEDELLKAQANTIRATNAYRQARNLGQNPTNQDMLTLRLTGNFGQQVVSERMGVRTDSLRFWESNAETNLIQDEVDLQRLATIYGADHPRYKALKARIEMSRAYLRQPDAAREEVLNKRGEQVGDLVRKMAEQELHEAQTIEHELCQKIEHEKAEAAQYIARHLPLQTQEGKTERLKAFYDVILKRIKELDVGENLAQITVTVVGPPTLSNRPVSPKISLVLLLGLLAGPMIGIGLSVILDRLDNKFRSPEDIQQTLGLPLVGNVPMFSAALTCSPSLLMAKDPRSSEAEALRTIRTWLFYRKEVRAFVVSSPLQGDGKSTVISNLASALAQTGKRTLLIDCDLRRPRIQSLWNLPPSRGLSYLLQMGQCLPEAIAAEIRSCEVQHLDLLPCGPIPAAPAELLEKPELLDILQWARTTYEYVLIDSPPLIPVADGVTLARLVDGLILVVRVQNDSRMMAHRAKSSVVMAGGTVLGVVANGIDPLTSYGYYHNDRYGYGKYAKESENKDTDPKSPGDDIAAAA